MRKKRGLNDEAIELGRKPIEIKMTPKLQVLKTKKEIGTRVGGPRCTNEEVMQLLVVVLWGIKKKGRSISTSRQAHSGATEVKPKQVRGKTRARNTSTATPSVPGTYPTARCIVSTVTSARIAGEKRVKSVLGRCTRRSKWVQNKADSACR